MEKVIRLENELVNMVVVAGAGSGESASVSQWKKLDKYAISLVNSDSEQVLAVSLDYAGIEALYDFLAELIHPGITIRDVDE